MKKFFVLAAFTLTLFAFTSQAFALQPYDFHIRSTHNGSPFQRIFVFSPNIRVGNGVFTQLSTETNSLFEEAIDGYLDYAPQPWLSPGQWYSIKAKLTFLPCTENIFQVYFIAADTSEVAPTFKWNSTGGNVNNGSMVVVNQVPTTLVGGVYTNPYYKYRYVTVQNCQK
jgi:hypothetical protein